LPWTTDASSLGFSPHATAARPWLPQPADRASLCVARQDGDRGSMLTLYCTALALRRARPADLPETLAWADDGDGVVSFDRGGGFRCLANL